ncbi:MAG TPA: HupE/UreJ family protein [Alphaproteobacteria bacterium]|nr:HupE/UreJ family protein [Alphaproteobacteria bacterium]
MKTLNESVLGRRAVFTTVLLAAALTPVVASAHPGFPGHTHGFINGVMHPLSGLDHLLAMTAVGLWAAQQGGKALWRIPLAFLSAMVLGGIVGMIGLGQFPMIDQGIAATVFVMGILIATTNRLSVGAGAVLAGLFALFHGYAHGAEMPATASGLFYGAGFVLATAALQLLGISMGLLARKTNSMRLVRIGGCAIAVCGIYLVFAR